MPYIVVRSLLIPPAHLVPSALISTSLGVLCARLLGWLSWICSPNAGPGSRHEENPELKIFGPCPEDALRLTKPLILY
jgi:hypothetical protein